jgi:hypothetical protein
LKESMKEGIESPSLSLSIEIETRCNSGKLLALPGLVR